MTSQPPHSSFGKSAKSASETEEGTEFNRGPGSMSTRWAALNDASNAVAVMAGLLPEATTSQIRNFPAVIRDVGGWRLEMAENGIQDLAAFMEPGLAALLAVNARGQDASTAALALWHEFHAARAALLTLPPETGTMGPRRSA